MPPLGAAYMISANIRSVLRKKTAPLTNTSSVMPIDTTNNAPRDSVRMTLPNTAQRKPLTTLRWPRQNLQARLVLR